MTITYIDSVSEQVPDTSTLIYTAPTITSGHIIYCVCHNEGAARAQLTINIVGSGDSVAVTNQYIKTWVEPNETKILSGLFGCILHTSDTIYAVSSVSATLNLKFGIKELST